MIARHFRVLRPTLLASALVLAPACKSSDSAEEHEHHDMAGSHEAMGAPVAGLTATAEIHGKSGSTLTGRAKFTQLSDVVLIEVWINGAPPGRHAVHIHEIGDCSSSDASSAGGHFNPGGHEHGGPHAPIHHAGDLGNMWIEEDGSGFHQITSSELTVTPGPYSVVGRSIVVHAKEDDLVSQPTGAAGGRIGCGEIE